MSKRRKIVFWTAGGIAVLLFLLLALILLLPYLVNLESVRLKILADVSRGTGGEVAFQRIDLSFFPRPHVVIHQGSLSIPGKIDGTLESLTVYPEILPLLRRRVRVTRLQVESPDIKMGLPEKKKEKTKEPEALSLETIPETLAPVFALLEEKAPGLVLLVKGGRLQMSEENRSLFWFESIDGSVSLPPGKLQVDLTCKSNLWESLSVKGWLDPKEFKSNGRLILTDFQPQILAKQFFPLATPRLSDSRVNLDLSFQTEGSQVFRAELKGSMPLLTLHHGDKKLAIKGKSLQGAFERDRDGTTVTLTELNFDYPELSLSGNLSIDQEAPHVTLELEGREIDVVSTRQVVLALAGKEPTIHEIFDLVRGGKVPLITLEAHGRSLADLGKTKNTLINGSIAEGNIFIPGAKLGFEDMDFDLRDVKGDALISEGILDAKNLEARWQNTQQREGTLRLGLTGKDASFHLEITVQADLSQVPPFLRHFIKDKAFAKEIARIHNVKGTAVGKLVLGESLSAIQAILDVSDFNLSARYQPLPYQLKIQSGQFSYERNQIGVKRLSSTLGKSSFSEITARLGFGEKPHIEILSGKTLISLDEIYPWLSSLKALHVVLKDVKSVQGALALSTLNLKGPLLSPEDWRFRVTGEVENLAVDSTLFPGPVAVNHGEFEATPEKLMFKETQARMLDASLQVSGVLSAYQEGVKKADFTLQGTLGPEIMDWGTKLIDLPPRLKVRSPLSISRAQASWDRDGRTLISGNVAVKDGPEIAVDVALNPDELMINKFDIQDKASQATLSAILKERELHLKYKGQLDKTTLDRLLVKNEMLIGRIDGDFEAHVLLDHPMRSTAQGKLQGTGLGYPLKLKAPFTIEDFSLNAVGNRLNLKSASLTWGDSHLNLDGNMDFSEKDFLLDMNLTADGLQWDKIEEIFKKEKRQGEVERGKSSWTVPLEGILRVKSEYFKYDRFTWRPLHADISFDDDRVQVAVKEANLCGISTPGSVIVYPGNGNLSLDFGPMAAGQELESTLVCLFSDDMRMTGDFEFKADIRGQGKSEEPMESLSGDFEFKSSDGLIKRDVRLAQVLGFLNLTEALTGRLPDMGKEGIAYNSLQILGDLEKGKLRIKEASLDGKTLGLSTQGQIDLIDQKMDFIVLVAPQKTVDRVVKLIPGVRYILGGSLISYPVRVRGDFKNPKVSALSPSAVGSELFGIMKRTVGLPIEMMSPLRPNKEKKKSAPEE